MDNDQVVFFKALRVTSPLAALVALPVGAKQAGKIVEGVPMQTEDTCVDGCAQTIVPAAIITATTPAIANHYTNSACGGEGGADTGGGDGGAIGDVVAPGNTTPTMAGTAGAGDTPPPAGGDVQGVHGHFLPRTFMEEDLHGADP